jgi:hypothetical protein
VEKKFLSLGLTASRVKHLGAVSDPARERLKSSSVESVKEFFKDKR